MIHHSPEVGKTDYGSVKRAMATTACELAPPLPGTDEPHERVYRFVTESGRTTVRVVVDYAAGRKPASVMFQRGSDYTSLDFASGAMSTSPEYGGLGGDLAPSSPWYGMNIGALNMDLTLAYAAFLHRNGSWPEDQRSEADLRDAEKW